MRFIIDAWADGYDNQKDEEEAIRALLEDGLDHAGSSVKILEVIHDDPDPYIYASCSKRKCNDYN